MKIRKSIASTNENNIELKSIDSSSCHHPKTYKMKSSNSSGSSSLWRRVLGIGLLLQILVNRGKLITIMFIYNFHPLSVSGFSLSFLFSHFHFVFVFFVVFICFIIFNLFFFFFHLILFYSFIHSFGWVSRVSLW